MNNESIEIENLFNLAISAISNNKFTSFEFIVNQCPAIINYQNAQGMSLILASVIRKRLKFIRYLYNRRCKINIRDNTGATVLHYINLQAHKNCTLMLGILKGYGANPEIENNHGLKCGVFFKTEGSLEELEEMKENIAFCMKKQQYKNTNLQPLNGINIQKGTNK